MGEEGGYVTSQKLTLHLLCLFNSGDAIGNGCHCRTIWKTINLYCAESIDMYALKNFQVMMSELKRLMAFNYLFFGCCLKPAQS